MFGFFKTANDVGIDLGTASVLAYVKGKGVVLEEPSVVAINAETKEIMAVGTDAQKMLGRTPENIVAIRPLRDGVISDYNMTEKMLRCFLTKICKKRLFRPRVVICVPSGVTEVEARAVREASMQAGASRAFLIEEPIAAAIGAGINISLPEGNMVVDIGGGTTDVAVISLDGIVESASIKVAGDKFDEALIKYIKKNYNVLIGERTAEELKKEVGSVFNSYDHEIKEMQIKGRSLVTGLPETITISSEETRVAFEESADAIVEVIKSVIEKTPPELVGDISTNGIVLTGGGSLVKGLDKLISLHTGIDCRIAPDAVSCVALGTGKALSFMNSLQEVRIDKYQI
ncbi:MAG: rod shape-determining protein [Clostridia bacterium]|nr:rod shape-determining protein [Clostridia bacterium]